MTSYTHDPVAYIGVAQLIAEYMDCVDSHNFDRLEELFTGAVLVTPSGDEITDTSGLRAGYSKAHPGPRDDGKRPTKHNLTNLRVRAGALPNHFAADAYYLIVDGSTGEAKILRTGRYKVEAELRDGEWLLRRLQVIHDI